MDCTVMDSNGDHVILDPQMWAGKLMATHVDEERCSALMPGSQWPVICPLPRGHECHHLAASQELYEMVGTMKPVSWVDL
jgi:hypothetical protein